VKYFLVLVFFLFSIKSYAAWLDTSGTVVGITTYASTETILITLSANGRDVQECASKNVFAIGKDLSVEARARMYSMLLAAQATGRTVVVSYSEADGCEPWGSTQNVYRRIVRLR